MSNQPTLQLVVQLASDSADNEELADLTRQLQSEIAELNVESISPVSGGPAPEGTKAVDWAMLGQLAVTLAPTVIPPLFDLLKSWTARRPTIPVKLKVQTEGKSAEIEYDPTTTSTADLEKLMRSLLK